jgi:hypothetical protein
MHKKERKIVNILGKKYLRSEVPNLIEIKSGTFPERDNEQ